jgi:hypothetical protein
MYKKNRELLDNGLHNKKKSTSQIVKNQNKHLTKKGNEEKFYRENLNKYIFNQPNYKKYL